MSSEPPPPYPGGPTAPLLEEKSGAPPTPGRTSPAVMQPPPGMSMPPADIGPPPYEPPGHPMPQPGFIPPHVNADGTYMPPGFYPPPGPHPPMGYYPPGPYPPGPYAGPGGHTATVLVPSGAATTVTVLQGEIFEGAPVQTVCPHCQQAITTKISYEIGLMNFVLGFFCCFMGRYCSRSSCGTGLGQAGDKEGAAPSGGSALVDTCPGPEPTLYFVDGLSVNLLTWTAVSCCRPSPGLALPLHGLLSL
ncbi:cell death-inducing p53-target protein 1 isoform X1 [Eumetopias jubatus]|uniref:cell death-inducing p53-target protein 1 isoform X1 n=1 Tax=Eumetopias jubatus TaxID=34886 RepID=UPI0010167E92|nr:cell death-inducing p53-target protein 1 isoform X1 [Eumetopias jubatus]XP_027973404.1 cell death-inducing p53-target protein 1 isoform X1 [Eumetopias jubatus]XP_027973405.1 cell death-inducing p53-target protein 1 isoform X1 [Eumetopias jubatus]XP_027973406.1 cell death-inducing p53-target protein 1 isoform X1 [Eumetopias jubatus]XP_027973407.1 cell death-inducing p53-target protein 1 isoform X1 [Eumetopias jubatus]XP_027973408.1 cell death-inducing p53-target protein 1 isoform X1 [Eumetop